MMWKFLVIAATLAFAEENADSSKKSKFPVQVEPETGAPKEGEGLGGVAVLLKPMPEATTMKTWSFLKESMLKIGDQVAQIMSVRNDMSMLQQDLTLQEKLWHQAEIKMNQENALLRSEVEALERKVHDGAVIKGQLMKVEQSLAEEKRRTADLKDAADQDAKRWKLETQYLNERRDNVTSLHKKVNETASKEISRAEAVHLQLQKDAVTLRLAQGDFQDREKNAQEQMDFEASKAAAEKAELTRQISAMKAGLERIKGKLKPRHIYDATETELKQGLQKETSKILTLQAEQQQVVTACMTEMQELDAIKCAEEGKAKSRLAEKTQFCNAIQVQNQVLKQDLAKCGSLAGIGPKPAANIRPGGLANPVLVRDEERAAPAPAPY